MCCLVLDIAADMENYIKIMWVFINGNLQGCSILPSKIHTNKTNILMYKSLALKCAEQWKIALKWVLKHSTGGESFMKCQKQGKFWAGQKLVGKKFECSRLPQTWRLFNSQSRIKSFFSLFTQPNTWLHFFRQNEGPNCLPNGQCSGSYSFVFS